MKEYGWIAWIIAAILVFVGFAVIGHSVSCSWYANTPSKDVPNRCVGK